MLSRTSRRCIPLLRSFSLFPRFPAPLLAPARFSTSGAQKRPSYAEAAPTDERAAELEELKQRLRELGPLPANMRAPTAAEVPEGYVDAGSLSGNPALATVPVHGDGCNHNHSHEPKQQQQQQQQQPRLAQDVQEASVFHHSPSSSAADAAIATVGGDAAAVAAAVGGGALGKVDPRVVISFTCNVCDTKLVKSMSKKSYTEGVVIIRCDGCKNNHLIADNLGWFDDHNINIEDIMHEQGKTVTKGTADDLTPEMLAQLERAAKQARPEDLAAPIGGATQAKAEAAARAQAGEKAT